MSSPLDPLLLLLERSAVGRDLQRLAQSLSDTRQIGGVRAAARPLLLAFLARHVRLPCVWVVPTHAEAERLAQDAALFLGDPPLLEDARARHERPYVLLFAERELSLFDVGTSDPDRLRVLTDVAAAQPVVVVTPVLALLQRTASPRAVADDELLVERGHEIDPQVLLAALVEKGYERTPMVEHRGQFSRRGGILDIFPSTGDPVRLEFFGDVVEQMRAFNIDTQLSVQPLQSVKLLPMREGERGAYLTQYLPPEVPVILEEPARLKLRVEEMAADSAPRAEFVAHSETSIWPEVLELLGKRPRLDVTSWGADEATADLFVESEPVSGFSSRLEEFCQFATAAEDDLTVVTHQAHRLTDILRHHDVSIEKVHVVAGTLAEGFRLPQVGVTVITDKELFGTSRRHRFAKPAERGSTLRLEDLQEGDAVVHLLHGIGRFEGLQTLSIQGSHKDFLKLSYAKGDSLFVPTDQMQMVTKYVGLDGGAPTLSRLGRGEWQRTRQKVSEEVKQMTERLLALYAERRATSGHAFGADTPWQEELEASFPYDETPHQERAIEQVKQDMEDTRPMDRLICGDVGYGKTEVAIRAAFKAIMGGKQAAVLVPTTVLAQQHYETFRERLEPFPVKVEMLSRFRTGKQQQETVAGLADGSVDLVIGTHRLLQQDVKFKRLGLVVVDEEQHFGVEHKERLKEMCLHVDVITLTATPIPRTMHMSLLGVRDLSRIDTPPEARLPIKTYLFEYSPEVVAGAITRELERDGQIFFLHNRVRGIEKVAADVRSLVPGARVAVAHGQMSEDRLEKTLLDFVEGEYDVLVCTTIIESGVDMPNVNTILINNAHMFGLGQLYQLRGRVGRAHWQAYCYLMYPPQRSLTPEAEKRLETIREFTALGSGYQIALRDLEIRGAGNLLGAEQSGHIAALGFSLYCQMLEEAVALAQGRKVEQPQQEGPVLELPVEAYLPDDYVSDARQKITLYRRLAEMKEDAEVDAIRDEVRDRFGPLPEPVERLLELVRLRLVAIALGVPTIKYRESYAERAIVCLMPFITAMDKRQLSRLQELTGARASFGNHQLVFSSLPHMDEWVGALLRGLRWLHSLQ